MNVWQHCALWLATDNRNNLRSLYVNHPATEEEMGAFYDFQISKVYDDEARRLAFLSWLYRFASRRRIDSAIVNSKVTPGPFGVRALEQFGGHLKKGKFMYAKER